MDNDNLEEVIEDLDRVQTFDPKSLIQKERLGAELSFEKAVKPAERLVSLFKKLPKEAIGEFPDQQILQIQGASKGAYNLFDQVLNFNQKEADPESRQTNLVHQLNAAYQQHFSEIFPYISFAVARTVDFNSLAAKGRAAVQSVQDQSTKLLKSLDEQKDEASNILAEVRKVAAEQGVSQQATYFKEQADDHKEEAASWRKYTIWMAIVVGVFGIIAMFSHIIPGLSSDKLAVSIQIIAGKILVFFVLSYMLSFCAKNYLSSRHNEVVNRHRQNSLMTYKALVDAGGTSEARDVVLNHAAGSIYNLHDSGFSKSSAQKGSSSSTIVSMLPKASVPLDGS